MLSIDTNIYCPELFTDTTNQVLVPKLDIGVNDAPKLVDMYIGEFPDVRIYCPESLQSPHLSAPIDISIEVNESPKLLDTRTDLPLLFA